MQGLEIARGYYEKFGRPMLEAEFFDVIDRIAVGLIGEGSECLGYDDELSRDHDFEPGFCLFITAEDDARFGFKLQRAYDRLPHEFCGLCRNRTVPVGGRRHGVIILEDFYTKYLGDVTAPNSVRRWLDIPSHALLTASNGEVFCDPLGELSRVRNILLGGYPEDIRRKKTAAHAVMMAQSGQYNYPRLLARGENGAAQLAAVEFVRHAISSIYLLNRRYEPFYKWVYRGLRELQYLSELEPSLIALTELDNSKGNAELKLGMIEDIAAILAAEYRRQGISSSENADLEAQAVMIQNTVKDVNIRNMHIMEGI